MDAVSGVGHMDTSYIVDRSVLSEPSHVKIYWSLDYMEVIHHFYTVFLCGRHTLIDHSQPQSLARRMEYYFHNQLKVEELHYKNSTVCIQAEQLKY